MSVESTKLVLDTHPCYPRSAPIFYEDREGRKSIPPPHKSDFENNCTFNPMSKPVAYVHY